MHSLVHRSVCLQRSHLRIAARLTDTSYGKIAWKMGSLRQWREEGRAKREVLSLKLEANDREVGFSKGLDAADESPIVLLCLPASMAVVQRIRVHTDGGLLGPRCKWSSRVVLAALRCICTCK
jgi:hypothetical protein